MRATFDAANFVQCGVAPHTDAYPLLAPHLERRLVDRAHRAGSAAEVAGMFADTVLPER